MHFSFTFLFVPDVQQAMRFYERAFGLSVRVPPQGDEWGLLGDAGHPLGFEGYHVAPQRARGAFDEQYVRGAPAGFYLVHDVPKLEPAFRRAVDAGCRVLSGPEVTPAQNHVAWVVDPHGIVVELLERAPRRPEASRIEKALAVAAVALVVASLAVGVAARRVGGAPLAAAAITTIAAWSLWIGAVAGAWRSHAWRWRRPLLVALGFGVAASLGFAIALVSGLS